MARSAERPVPVPVLVIDDDGPHLILGDPSERGRVICSHPESQRIGRWCRCGKELAPDGAAG